MGRRERVESVYVWVVGGGEPCEGLARVKIYLGNIQSSNLIRWNLCRWSI